MLVRLGVINKVDTEIYYLSRCYATRHGAGPLAYDFETLKGIRVDDKTNIPNEFQGYLRLAPLNLHAMYDAIDWDKRGHPNEARYYTVVTCCDQIIPDTECLDYVKYIDRDGILNTVSNTEFIRRLDWEFDYKVYSPEGPL